MHPAFAPRPSPFTGPVVKAGGVLAAVLFLGASDACTRHPNLETAPIGARVEVMRHDGAVLRGTLVARDDRDVRIAIGGADRSIPRSQIISLELMDGVTPQVLPAGATFREFTVLKGTTLSVRLDSAVGSDTSHVGDPVQATLVHAVRADGQETLPVGSVLIGIVTIAMPSGKVRGRASLALEFRSISIGRGGETYAIFAGLQHTAAATKGEDAEKIGVPAAGGAIVGALVDGKKGAGIGALIGGGAGTAVVVATPGPEVRIPSGTALTMSLDQALDARVPITQ